MQPLYDALPAHVRLGFAESQDQVSVDQLIAGLTAGDRLLVKGSNRVFWVHGFVERLIAALEQGSTKKAAR
jgi:UDP-N-acetylmuramoyl-tripeptide--D-alanyl-D-alanine ligase